MTLLKLVLFIPAVYVSSIQDPDSGKDIFELVRSRGFDLEEFPIEVREKYLVKLHHIVRPKRCVRADPRKLVVFGIPLGGTSDIFVSDFVNNSWGFYLADHCFDVWLTNVRGNRHGDTYINGTKATSADDSFFDYTLVDIGVEDVTTQLDFVLAKTGQQKAFWFGMSQGAISAFAMLAKLPGYNGKIRAFASLAGQRQMCSFFFRPFKIAKRFNSLLLDSLLQYGFQNRLKGFAGQNSYLSQNCAKSAKACHTAFNMFSKQPDHGMYSNRSRLPIYLEHYPDGTSAKNILYYIQLTNECDPSGDLKDFDEDAYQDKSLITKDPEKYSRNLKKYGTLTPPLLKAKDITVPVKLYYSDGDVMASTKDNLRMRKTLPNVVGVYHIKDTRFAHMSFALVPYTRRLLEDVKNFYEAFLKPV